MDVLLVEDNDAHAELVMRNLEHHRVANVVHHVTDGEAALDYLFGRGAYIDQQSHKQVNLVLLDLRLPKFDGLEVLRQIKQSDELKRIPVVILTTSHAERDVANAYEHNANSYVTKPLDYEKFAELMDEIGYYWLAWNQNPWLAKK
ncbi:MAG: response regulator [Candidatus Thiodiazotropha endolucinida]